MQKNDNDINIKNQIRFAVEHKLLPQKIEEDPIYVITSIIFEKGKYINKLYNALYSLNKLENPYKDSDFIVSNPFNIGDVKAIKIEMPKNDISLALCESVYIVFNDKYTKYLYLTKELSGENVYKLASWIDSEHEVIGEISDNEIDLIKDTINNEEITPEKYSNVLDELINNDKVNTSLPTTPDEIKKHKKIFITALMQSQNLKKENKQADALNMLKKVIKTEASKYIDTDDKEYHCFHNPFEILLYANLYHPYNYKTQKNKDIIGTQVDLSSAYLIFGAMMIESKDFDKAIDILWKAVDLNPVNVQLLFALADAYKGKRFFKTYYSLMKRAHVCAIRKVDIARIYRNYAFYFTTIKNYDLAVNLAYASSYFDKNEELKKNLLNQIKSEANIEYNEPSLDDIKKTLKENSITWGAKELAINVAKNLENQYKQANNEQGIKLCQAIFNELNIDF